MVKNRDQVSGSSMLKKTYHRKRLSRRMSLERLERREVLASQIVTSLADIGPGSLREAIEMANVSTEVDTIEFDLSSLGAGPHTVNLQSTLEISRSMSIIGPGADQLTLDGGWVPGSGGGVRIMQLSESDGSEEFVSISGLTLSHGSSIPSEIVGGGAIKSNSVDLTLNDMVFSTNNADQGGAVYIVNLEAPETFTSVNLFVRNGQFINNSAFEGGAIFNELGHVELSEGSIVRNNTASLNGGGIFTKGLGENIAPSTLLVYDSIIENNSATVDGGGIYNFQDHVEFFNSSISGNTSGGDGGGVWTRGNINFGGGDSTLWVFDSQLNNNTSGDQGGAVYAVDDEVLFRDSTVSNNSAKQGGGVFTTQVDRSTFLNVFRSTFSNNTAINSGVGAIAVGGAIAAENQSQLNLQQSVFANNSVQGAAESLGGAVYSAYYMTIFSSEFSNNSASGGASAGGAIWTNSLFSFGNYVVFSSLSGNSADKGGAIYFNSDATLNSSTLNNNQAVDGGAIWTSSELQAVNSTLSGNSASKDGGALYIGASVDVSVLTHLTVTGNRSDSDGNGIGSGGGLFTDGPQRLDNTIVAGNLIGGSTTPNDVTGTLSSLSVGNLVGVDTGVGGITNGVNQNQVGSVLAPIVPGLAPLADNGGLTLTHALLDGSPALNSGNGFVATTTDQRNDGFGIETGFHVQRFTPVDIGAFERSTDFGDAPATYPVTLANDGARHEMVSNLRLGRFIDSNSDGSPTVDARGDDTISFAEDDEDGVVFRFVTATFQARADVTASASGRLSGWIDFNRDGDWDDVGEQILTDQAVVAGVNPVDFAVGEVVFPEGANSVLTYARFRLSTQAGLTPRGAAPDGEVEDYRIRIEKVVLPTSTGTDGTFNFTEEPVVRRTPRGFDPLLATGYDYVVQTGPSFATLELPPGYGDNVFTVNFPGFNDGSPTEVSLTLNAGQELDFENGTIDGVFAFEALEGGAASFRITGIELSAAVDATNPEAFLTIISFTNDGEIDFTQTPIAVYVALDDSGATSENSVLSIDAPGVLANDTYTGATVTVTEVNDAAANVGAVTTLASGATVVLNANGSYTYDPNTAFDSLRAEQTGTDTFSYKTTDGFQSDIASVTIVITGSNDAATIVGTSTGSVTEDAAGSASGTLSVLDVDNGEAAFQSESPTSIPGTYGSFTFALASGTWTYTLDNSRAATNALAGGQIVHDTFTVSSLDGTATQVIDVTITGANDAATITGTATGSVTEDAATSTASGDLDVADVDSLQTFQSPSGLSGTYGSFTFDATTGVWGYSLSNADPDTNALAAGQIVHDTLTVTSSDGTATQVIDVTITGANDAATITGTATGSVTEDAATSTASGDLNVADVDSPQTFQSPSGLSGTYGTFTFDATTGAWSYSLDNTDPDTNALATGQVVHDTLTVTSIDGTATQVIDVTITGNTDDSSNAPPTASVAGPTAGVRGQELTFTLSATDSAADSAAGFEYRVQWGDGTPDTIVSRTANNGTGVTVRHTFAATGSYNVRVVAVDQQNAASVEASRTVSITAIGVQTDPNNPNGTALVVGGTSGNDDIEIKRVSSQLRVKLNGVTTNYANTFSRIFVYGQAGNDDIKIVSSVTTPALLFGGDGNDKIEAGNAATVLSGGAGNDELKGGQARDILIGGIGRDDIRGKGDDDILIGGTTVHDHHTTALCQILDEWASNNSYQARTSSLQNRLNTSTVFDDEEVDELSGSNGRDWYFVELNGLNRDELDAVFDEIVVDLL